MQNSTEKIQFSKTSSPKTVKKKQLKTQNINSINLGVLITQSQMSLRRLRENTTK